MEISSIGATGVSPASPGSGASKASEPQNHSNLPGHAQDVSEASKSGGMYTAMDGCGNGLSTEDMVKLIMAVQMMEQMREMTADIIQKFVDQ